MIKTEGKIEMIGFKLGGTVGRGGDELCYRGAVSFTTLVSQILLDLRYSSDHNFCILRIKVKTNDHSGSD